MIALFFIINFFKLIFLSVRITDAFDLLIINDGFEMLFFEQKAIEPFFPSKIVEGSENSIS